MKGVDFSTLFKLYNKMGYPFYDTGRFNVNLCAFRNDDPNVVDQFNDMACLTYIDDFGRPNALAIKMTTKPGAYWLGDKMGNANGTFVLAEGYYKNGFKQGKHKGQYDCLVQNGSGIFKGHRDNNKDGIVDYDGPLYEDVTGLNFHTTSFLNDKEKVGAYSAGCQVSQDDKDHLLFMAILFKSIEIYGNKISYALFNTKDFF
jgi:hypothetical protein